MYIDPLYNSEMALDAVVMMRFPADVKAALQLAAIDERRSMSNLALSVLSEWLAERGYLSPPGHPKKQEKKRARG
jgi:hypothetical protein